MSERMLHTSLCDILGIKDPILLAGMGGASTPALAVSVSNAGGLGIHGAASRTYSQRTFFNHSARAVIVLVCL